MQGFSMAETQVDGRTAVLHHASSGWISTRHVMYFQAAISVALLVIPNPNQPPSPDHRKNVHLNTHSMAAPNTTYTLYITNDSDIPIRVSYKTGSQGKVDTRTIDTLDPTVTTRADGLSVDQPLRVLVQPQYTAFPDAMSNNWDVKSGGIPSVPDGAVIYVPADVAEEAAAEEKVQGLFAFTYTLVNKPTPANPPSPTSRPELRFKGSIICGRWFTDCPTALNGVPVQTYGACTGFQSNTGRSVCESWCAIKENTSMCDFLKDYVCHGLDGSDNYKRSPECVCINGPDSQVRFPELSNLTYSELITALNQTPGWSLKGAPEVCWFPGCTSRDSLKTSTQKAVMSSCPTPPTQICAVSVGQIIFDDSSSNNNVDLINCCLQSSTALPKPSVSPSSAGGPAGSPAGSPSGPPAGTPSGPPAPTPTPAQPPSSGLSTGAIIGIVVGAVVLFIVILVMAIILSKKK
jgi:hypothetical protein